MSVADDIAYLRSISSATLMTVSVHRLRQIADVLQNQENTIETMRTRAAELQTEVEDIMRKLNRGPL